MWNRRYRHGAVSCGIIVAALLAPVPIAGQGDSPPPSARTPWGDPDLQGIWNFGTLTPMERPESLAGRAARRGDGQPLSGPADRDLARFAMNPSR